MKLTLGLLLAATLLLYVEARSPTAPPIPDPAEPSQVATEIAEGKRKKREVKLEDLLGDDPDDSRRKRSAEPFDNKRQKRSAEPFDNKRQKRSAEPFDNKRQKRSAEPVQMDTEFRRRKRSAEPIQLGT